MNLPEPAGYLMGYFQTPAYTAAQVIEVAEAHAAYVNAKRQLHEGNTL